MFNIFSYLPASHTYLCAMLAFPLSHNTLHSNTYYSYTYVYYQAKRIHIMYTLDSTYVHINHSPVYHIHPFACPLLLASYQ